MTDRHVFENRVDSDETRRYSSAHLDDDGQLVITTHDRGPSVEDFFGAPEYEALETFSAEQTARLVEALGQDLIAAIAEKFPDSLALSKYVESTGIGHGRIWNRIRS